MDFSVLVVVLATAVLFASMFFVAYLGEEHILPAHWIKHPVVYIASLGIFASVWAFFGSIGFAYQFGYSFLAYFVGVTGAFLLAPIFLLPILRLRQAYQLQTLADLFAYRYRSQFVGGVVTLVLCLGVLPLLAMQIQAIVEIINIVSEKTDTTYYLFFYLSLIGIFTWAFGAKHITWRRKHEGLVYSIAFTSVVKLLCVVLVVAFSFREAFFNYNGLESWLGDYPQGLEVLYGSVPQNPWRSLVLAFFTAAVAMPHMYHMIFSENLNVKALYAASWGFPLYLFVIALTIPIILWAAIKLNVPTNPEYFLLGLALVQDNIWLVGGVLLLALSAASAVLIIVTLSLSIMVSNYWVLSVYQPLSKTSLYTWLVWIRRFFIFVLLLTSFGFYSVLKETRDLSELGLLSFVATLQFLPGLIGVLFWPRATRKGFMLGLSVGFCLWLFGMCMPMFSSTQTLGWHFFDLGYTSTIENWQLPAFVAIFLNSVLFIIGSLLTKQSPAEQVAADNCTIQNFRRPYRWELKVVSVPDMIDRLTCALGYATAKREVELALQDLSLTIDERKPYALRRLRDQLETNLSALFGPALALDVVEESLPYETQSGPVADDIHYMEQNLEDYQDRLTGLAGELDHLRRFHRQILTELPLGLISLSKNGEVISWNRAIEVLTGISAWQVIGSEIHYVAEPWRDLLSPLLSQPQGRVLHKTIEVDYETRWLKLNTMHIQTQQSKHELSGLVIMIEDLTDRKKLEAKLAHSDRLASIGKLAAGVAHEIGNPVTGIACLSQELRGDSKDPRVVEMLEQILAQTKRISQIVQSLVVFSHSGHMSLDNFEPILIRDSVENALHLVGLSPNAKGLILQNETDENVWILGEAQKFQQVMINLLTNACDASSDGQVITVSTSFTDDRKITIKVLDRGCGIDPRLLKNIFDPFVSSKAPGQGTGLGLSLVYSIVEEHHGYTQIKSPVNQGAGTEVAVTLPRYYPEKIR